jgi:hypothetical protein
MRDKELKLEDLVLRLIQLLLVARHAHDEFVFGFLQLGLLFPDDITEQLVLQSVQRNHEVDKCHLDTHIGEIVWVRHFGSHIELEGRVIVYVLLSHAYEDATTLLE